MNHWTKPLLFTFLICALSLAVFPLAATMQDDEPSFSLTTEECNDLGLNCPAGDDPDAISGAAHQAIRRIANVFLSIVALIALAIVVLGGFMYIISIGDEDRTRTAKKTILYALVGLIVIGLSAAIVNFILSAIAP